MQGKINRGIHNNHPAGRHSILTKQCPPPPSPIFYRPDALPAAKPTVKALKASPNHNLKKILARTKYKIVGTNLWSTLSSSVVRRTQAHTHTLHIVSTREVTEPAKIRFHWIRILYFKSAGTGCRFAQSQQTQFRYVKNTEFCLNFKGMY